MGRPAGSRDKQLRKKRGEPVDTGLGEFAPDRVVVPEKWDEETKPDEPSQESWQAFAVGLVNSPEYRESLRQRAKAGRLAPAEARLLVETAKTAAPEKKKGGGMREAIEYMTGDELQVFARLMALVIGRQKGEPLRDDPARRYESVNLVGVRLTEWRAPKNAVEYLAR